jgi:hypothetical protein
VSKQGSKKFFKILKDEMKDITISVFTNIAGKQKNLALLTDKLVGVFRQVVATPQILQDPMMVSMLNQIMESSGLNSKFNVVPAQVQPGASIPSGASIPLKELAQKGVKQQQTA